MSDLIAVDKLHHHPDNPPERITDVAELAASIRAVGVLQSLLVEPDGDGYVVIAGNRRLAAARAAGLTAVPCTVRANHNRLAHTEVRLIENGHRKNLTPLEQADAFGELRADGLTQTEIAARTGFSAGHVSARLALLELNEATRQRIASGVISPEAALAAVRQVRGNTRAPRPRPAASPATPVFVPEGPFSAYFSADHPVYSAAAARHRTEHGGAGDEPCPPCWEAALRADERWVVEEGEFPVEPGEVFDHGAVERAASMHGPVPPLEPGDRDAAARLMRDRGHRLEDIAARLALNERYVRQITSPVLANIS